MTEVERVSGAHRDYVCDIAVCNPRFVTASGDSTVVGWDARTLTKLATLKGHMDRVACDPINEKWVVTGSLDKTVRLYTAHNYALINVISGLHSLAVQSLKFLGDDHLLSTSADSSLCVTCLRVKGLRIVARAKTPFPVRDTVALCDGQIGIVGDNAGAAVVPAPNSSAEIVQSHAEAQVAMDAVMGRYEKKSGRLQVTTHGNCGGASSSHADIEIDVLNGLGIPSLSLESFSNSD